MLRRGKMLCCHEGGERGSFIVRKEASSEIATAGLTELRLCRGNIVRLLFLLRYYY